MYVSLSQLKITSGRVVDGCVSCESYVCTVTSCNSCNVQSCCLSCLVLVHILQVVQISQVILLPCKLPWFSSYRRTRQLYNTVYWKPTSIQIIENIPLMSLVDIRILLKESIPGNWFSPAIPCCHTRAQEHTWMWEAPWAPSRNIDKALKRRASA